MSHDAPDRDPKVRATATIWGCAIGMFGICIPLVAITKSGVVLPLMVLLGAGGSTAVVWAADKRQLEASQLAQTVQALEERVMNLETIYISLPEAQKPHPLSPQEEPSDG